ncbi:uncharacterized protein F4822DRAFT_414478 [Hypoxylon trugodes]|uniref:uncharacterized protein n=1 Tax=Hypoxylon trugodes TaxID=326681 RepID=UPI0021A177C1|nr:uncharacterized protein F4822DRAFT_414478 [Hypoxylon trugodes]KAI1385926.1 hypothetical protein F4822DRAFT_414478 [Hypoxylon trugodes]
MLRTISTTSRLFFTPRCLIKPLWLTRSMQHQPYDASFDQEELAEAREWHTSFNRSQLPKGYTNYSRSSGPGGQHVNKTETKATTVWPVKELSKSLPKLVFAALRSSRYYSKGNDSISIQCQTQRSRSANENENHLKLAEEIEKIYKENVPGVSSQEKAKKHEALRKKAYEARANLKKYKSSKKSERRGNTHDS